MADESQYHQDGRDMRASVGFWALAALLATAVVACVALGGCGDAGDGSTAGANAITLDDLGARDEWESGEWSVTTEDLAREWEPGHAYPANGKGAPIAANTTYGRGGGMVDLVTYDKATNAMIRHYGQLGPDGRVRWYAAETVLDEDGKPRIMPQG